jgi:hypothetical protein
MKGVAGDAAVEAAVKEMWLYVSGRIGISSLLSMKKMGLYRVPY